MRRARPGGRPQPAAERARSAARPHRLFLYRLFPHCSSLHWPLSRWAGLLAFLCAGLVLLGGAQARTVRIVSADRLELRRVTLNPDGTRSSALGQEAAAAQASATGQATGAQDGADPDTQEIVVISGAHVELRVDDDVVRATRVEFNRTTRTLTLVGTGVYETTQNGQRQVLRGENLVVDLRDNALSGEDVLISTAALEISGSEVQKVPGQLTAQHGSFSTCARCGRTPDDYSFRAESILLYPGDRLVAYQATLLLAGAPVLYLPVVVIPLQDQSRQPRLSVGYGADDALTVESALPFVAGSSVIGTTLLNYYQNRPARFGFGTDLSAYAPFPWVDRLDLYALANPRAFQSGVAQDGYEVDLNFGVKGHWNLPGSVSGLRYTLSAVRTDIGRLSDDPQRGVTDIVGTAGAEYPDFTVRLNYRDRYGPASTVALPQVLTRPELVLDPKPYVAGKLSADFKFTVGAYTAASNPLSPSATAAGVNFSSGRLEENHVISYSTQFGGSGLGGAAITPAPAVAPTPVTPTPAPGTPVVTAPSAGAPGLAPDTGGSGPGTGGPGLGGPGVVVLPSAASSGSPPFVLTLANTFTGHYYLTGARVVDLNVTASLSRTFSVGNSLRASYVYLRQEGTSPFAFDALATQRLSAVLSFEGSVTPRPGLTFGVTLPYDFFLSDASFQLPATFSVQVSREPVSASLRVSPNLFAGTLNSVYLDSVVGQNRPLVVGLQASYTGPVGGSSASGQAVLSLDALGGPRSNTFGTKLSYDAFLNRLTSVNLHARAVSTRDAVLNPFSFAFDDTVTLPYDGSDGLASTPPRSSGTISLTRGDVLYSLTHTLTFDSAQASADNVYFSVSSQAGANDSWNLRYGGIYSLSRGGFTAPAATLAVTRTRPGQRLSAQASLNLPGLDQSVAELGAASLAATYDFGRSYLSGAAYYTRTRSGASSAATVTDTLTFQPLTYTFALGGTPGLNSGRPGAYVSTTLRQTLTWLDGILQAPGGLRPIVLVTVDRCCWAFQAEVNPIDQRFRIGFNLGGGGGFTSGFSADANGVSVPLLNPNY